MAQLILGSSSAPRCALLRTITTYPFETMSPHIDETIHRGERPDTAIQRLVRSKMQVCAQNFPQAFIITADTMAICRGQVLDKTTEEATARRYLALLSGRSCTVMTAICARSPQGKEALRLVKTRVRIKRLTSSEIDALIEAHEWENVSGAFAVTGYAERFVISINGSYSNIIGLPAYETVSLLSGLGLPL